jgi:hypothetical protein
MKMKKNSPSESGFFNARVLIAISLCSVGVSLAMFSFAATPASGTLTDTSGPLTYTGGPFFVANPTPILFVDQGPECSGSAQPCDDYVLTVTLPAGYAAAHPNAGVKATLSWTDSGSGSSDYDFYIYRGIVHDTDGSQAADYQSASSSDPEIATISPVSDGTQHTRPPAKASMWQSNCCRAPEVVAHLALAVRTQRHRAFRAIKIFTRRRALLPSLATVNSTSDLIRIAGG